MPTRRALFAAALGAVACRKPAAEPLTIAAAANLAQVLPAIGAKFTQHTQIRVRFSFGSTALLAQQIRQRAPFDVFVAADEQFVAELARDGRIVPASVSRYARGQLALLTAERLGRTLQIKDLSDPALRAIALANPKTAPYGTAAEQALSRAGLLEPLRPKLVYGTDVSAATQYARAGSADAAFTAWSLVLGESRAVLIEEAYYAPLWQSAGAVAESSQRSAADDFLVYLHSADARRRLQNGGYLLP